jgi:hypothetical protein
VSVATLCDFCHALYIGDILSASICAIDKTSRIGVSSTGQFFPFSPRHQSFIKGKRPFESDTTKKPFRDNGI